MNQGMAGGAVGQATGSESGVVFAGPSSAKDAAEEAAERASGTRPLALRARHRELLGWGVALCLACIGWSWWPHADVVISATWFNGRAFNGNQSAVVSWMYEVVPWLGRAMAVAAPLVWLARRAGLRPALVRPRCSQRLVVLSAAMVVVVGLLVNGLLKQHSGRPRPVATVEFGGSATFQPALSFAGDCPRNCSFVSGHAATGFVVMAWGLFGTVARRRRWLLFGLAAGAVTGLGRVMQGGHFASDIVFAAIAVGLGCLALRACWLHWRCWRLRRGRARRAVAEGAWPSRGKLPA